jgi:hypothetical protein
MRYLFGLLVEVNLDPSDPILGLSQQTAVDKQLTLRNLLRN